MTDRSFHRKVYNKVADFSGVVLCECSSPQLSVLAERVVVAERALAHALEEGSGLEALIPYLETVAEDAASNWYETLLFVLYLQENHGCVHCNTLNGSNGEVTGDDDRGIKQRVMSKKDRAAVKRAVTTQRRRATQQPRPAKPSTGRALQQVNGGTSYGAGGAVRAMKEGQSMSADAQYKLGLFDAFDTRVTGVVVPDAYPFPTERAHVTKAVTLSAITTLAFDILPDPCATIIGYGPLQNASGDSQLYDLGGSSGSGWCIKGLTDPERIDDIMSAARVVSFGVRLRNAQPFGSVQGRVIAVPFIIPQTHFTAMYMKAHGTDAAKVGAIIGDLYRNLHDTSAVSLLSLSSPGAIEMQCDQLINNDLLLSFRPVGPLGTTFKNCYTGEGIGNGTGGYNLLNAGMSWGDTSGVAFQGSTSEWGDPHDWIGWQIQMTGFDPTGPQLEMEIICHVEGQPVTSATLVPSSIPANKKGGVGVEAILRNVALDALAQLAPPVLKAGAGLLRRMVR